MQNTVNWGEYRPFSPACFIWDSQRSSHHSLFRSSSSPGQNQLCYHCSNLEEALDHTLHSPSLITLKHPGTAKIMSKFHCKVCMYSLLTPKNDDLWFIIFVPWLCITINENLSLSLSLRFELYALYENNVQWME